MNNSNSPDKNDKKILHYNYMQRVQNKEPYLCVVKEGELNEFVRALLRQAQRTAQITGSDPHFNCDPK